CSGTRNSGRLIGPLRRTPTSLLQRQQAVEKGPIPAQSNTQVFRRAFTGFVQLRLDSVPLLREAVGKVCHDLRNQLIATANGLFTVVDEAALYRDPSRAVSLCQLRGKERHQGFVLLGARYAHGRAR